MNNNIRKIVSEELLKVLGEQNFNYASDEREYADKQYYEEDVREATISFALSFIQDLQSSMNKLSEQKNFSNTNSDVDNHINQALNHINKAIQTYFKTIPIKIKNDVLIRLKEIKINQ